MARDQVDMTPIETRAELVAWFAAGEKPPEKFRVGTEHEKFAFTLARHEPVPYHGPRGIRALLEGMQSLLGWEPIMDGPNIIGLGMTPTWTRAEAPVMPKGRYRIMTAYMPTVGKLGLDMMYRTCTVQAN